MSEGIYESEVGLNSKKSYEDLFKVISSYTQIISFKEKIPNMNDIFIMKVKEGGGDE